MKKYVFMMAVCLAILSSCTNEEITIGNVVTMKVDPSGVISPFAYEINPGELEGLDEPYKLRIRILVYDENGQLKASDTQYLANYSNIMISSLDLPKGDYTAIAITDVVKLSGSDIEFEYWNLSGENVLSQLKVTDAGYIGSNYKVLGVGKQNIKVDDSHDDIVMRCSPAGAICLVCYYNIHAFDDVEKYGVLMTKSSESISYNRFGDYEVSVDNSGGDFDWWLSNLEPDNYTSQSIYGYYFVLPMNRVTLQFVADTADDRYWLGQKTTMSFEAGKQYLMELTLNNDANGGITSQFMEITDDYYAPQQRLQDLNVRKAYMLTDRFYQIGKPALCR